MKNKHILFVCRWIHLKIKSDKIRDESINGREILGITTNYKKLDAHMKVIYMQWFGSWKFVI
jgi:hypothetical protein